MITAKEATAITSEAIKRICQEKTAEAIEYFESENLQTQLRQRAYQGNDNLLVVLPKHFDHFHKRIIREQFEKMGFQAKGNNDGILVKWSIF